MDDQELAQMSDREYSSFIKEQGYVYGTFFKYREFDAVDSERRAQLFDLLANRSMWFAKPATLNDPFECYPTLSFGNPEDARPLLKKAVEDRVDAQNASGVDVEAEVDRLMRVGDNPTIEQQRFYDHLSSNIGIFSMSRRWDLSTQWAYYGGNGTGLCLGYDVKPRGSFDQVFDVTYTTERPTLNWPKMIASRQGEREPLFESVLTKSPEWAHEAEVRALSAEPGLNQHPPGMLVRAIVGHKATDESISWLIDTVSSLSEKPSMIERLELLDGRFGYKTSVLHSFD